MADAESAAEVFRKRAEEGACQLGGFRDHLMIMFFIAAATDAGLGLNSW